MSDLIDRQDAIDAIKNADVCVLYNASDIDIDDAIELAIRETKASVIASIEALPIDWKAMASIVESDNSKETQWIPCSERLPDKNGEYLITLEMMDGTFEVDIEMFNGKKWNYYNKSEVIAWTKLPEPYKAESEGEDETD